MADKIRDWLVERYPSQKSESPIEAMLFAAFEFIRPHLMLDTTVSLIQQAPMDKYRADFLFVITDTKGETQRLVVEVDGHDFHEKTKTQAAHDKARDRWTTTNGYELLRFTGSEIWANPFACVEEIANRLYMLRFGVSRSKAKQQAGLAALRALLGMADK